MKINVSYITRRQGWHFSFKENLDFVYQLTDGIQDQSRILGVRTISSACQSTVTFVILISWRGRSSASHGAAAIFFTTSIPCVTCPNTE